MTLDQRASSGPGTDAAALVLTWNSVDLIERCLTSLEAAVPRLHVMVVDNGSTDGTTSLISDRFPHVEVLQTGDNLGFAGGCNAGIRKLMGDGYASIFLLNPDAFVAPDCVTRLAAHLESAPGCAAVSPLIHDHPTNVVWFAGSDIDWVTGSTYHRGQGNAAETFGTQALQTDRINGGAVLLRTEALDSVGLFDESYFLYYEETDLSVRLERAGWALEVLPTARAWHEASSSTGGTLGRTYNYYLTRGRLLFLRKLAPPGTRWSRVFLHLVRETRWLVRTFGVKRSAPAVLARSRAILDFSLHRAGRASL